MRWKFFSSLEIDDVDRYFGMRKNRMLTKVKKCYKVTVSLLNWS